MISWSIIGECVFETGMQAQVVCRVLVHLLPMDLFDLRNLIYRKPLAPLPRQQVDLITALLSDLIRNACGSNTGCVHLVHVALDV